MSAASAVSDCPSIEEPQISMRRILPTSRRIDFEVRKDVEAPKNSRVKVVRFILGLLVLAAIASPIAILNTVISNQIPAPAFVYHIADTRQGEMSKIQFVQVRLF